MGSRQSASGHKHAARPAQVTAAEAAGAAALTTTLLAGAVSGAIAGVVERRQADDAAAHRGGDVAEPSAAEAQPHATSQTSAAPDAASSRHDPASNTASSDGTTPAQATPAPPDAGSAGHAVSGTAPAEVVGVVQSGTDLPEQVADGSASAPQPAALAPSADTLTATTTSHDAVAVAAVSQTAPADNGAAAQGGAYWTDPMTHLTDSGSAVTMRLDASANETGRGVHDIGGPVSTATQSIEGAVAEVSTAVAEIGADIAHSVAGTTAAITQATADIASSVGSIVEKTGDILAASLHAAIPARILGAETEDRPTGGFLSELFDKGDAITAPAETTHDALDVSMPLTHIAHADAGSLISDLAGSIEAVRIGFAGQSYIDAVDTHDGPAGSHGGLLHGLL